MIYIAKMHTRYPDYMGTGYYNFIFAEDEDALNFKIEEQSHDFSLEGTVATRFESNAAILKKYPTKQSLNDKYFKGE